MSNSARAAWTDTDCMVAAAMTAELRWAPLRFEGWGHYEQARPLMPNEPVEVIARWPDHGYVLQHRPELGELTQAVQTPVDYHPEVTVLGGIDSHDVIKLRMLAREADPISMAETASGMAKTNRALPEEPPVRTGSSIPAHEEIAVHYEPAGGTWLPPGQLIHERHPEAAYGLAGYWRFRLGPPVGLTPTGLLVFQPLGADGLRVTVEHPTRPPVGVQLDAAQLGIYRYDRLGRWCQTAVVRRVDELTRMAGFTGQLGPEQTPGIRHSVLP